MGWFQIVGGVCLLLFFFIATLSNTAIPARGSGTKEAVAVAVVAILAVFALLGNGIFQLLCVRNVVIDPITRLVGWQIGFSPIATPHSEPFSNFNCVQVTLRWRPTRWGGDTPFYYTVDLMRRDGSSLVLDDEDLSMRSGELGQSVAVMMGVPFEAPGNAR